MKFDKEEENKIVDLKLIFEDYARKLFKDTEKSFYRKIGRSPGWKDLRKEIDWKRFK
jgi:hypothetical protein